MHIHHLHALMHFIRLLGTMRLFGTVLLMLWISQIQFDGGKTALAGGMAKAQQQAVLVAPAASSALAGLADRADPVPPPAVIPSAHTSVFHRLMPEIFMIPRMNRTPKPKSVHRTFARSPGAQISYWRGSMINVLSS